MSRILTPCETNASYECYYDSTNPANASFFRNDVTFWDYFWLPFATILFLAVGVLPNLWLLSVLLRFPLNVARTHQYRVVTLNSGRDRFIVYILAYM